MQYGVRPARPEDAPAIARVHVESWLHNYRDLLPEHALLSRTVESRTQQWNRWLLEGGGRRVLVAERGGRIAGFAFAGPARDTDADPWTAELYALYLAPEGMHQGLGSRLWGALPDALAQAGFRQATLWVARDNARARAFYARCGFGEDGATKVEDFAGAPLPELRCRAGLPDLPFVAGLALALDTLDWAGAAGRLDPDCAYDTGQGTLHGRDDTIAALHLAAAPARARLDGLQSERQPLALGGGRFRIDQADRLRHQGQAHVFRCQQALTLPEGKAVTRIVHRELPGERARLQAFLRRVGVG